MEHSFDVDVAVKYGVEIAIVYKHILFWIIKNKSHNKNFKDGCYWTYFSISSLQSIFPYFSIKQLRNIIDKMKENRIIKVGNYNSQRYDRTLWYAFVEEPEELKKIVPVGIGDESAEKGKSICPNGQMDVPKTANGIAEKGKPIPYNNTDIKTDNSIILLQEIEPKKFVKPTIEEIENHCKANGYQIDAKQFYYFYEAKGWMIGKNKMKSWKAAIITWVRNRKGEKKDGAMEFLELGRK